MRKSLLITTLLALLLISASAVSAQPFSIFGGFGSGTLEVDGDNMPRSGGAIQVGVLTNVTKAVDVGLMYDRLTSSDRGYLWVDVGYGPEQLRADVLVALSGFDGILDFNLIDSDIALSVFAGAGLYNLETKLTLTDGIDRASITAKTESALGFVAGGQAKYPLNPNLQLTGNASYRSAAFTEETIQGTTHSLSEPLKVSGWSFGAGISVAF